MVILVRIFIKQQLTQHKIIRQQITIRQHHIIKQQVTQHKIIKQQITIRQHHIIKQQVT
jgi:hypothetical protein